MKENADIAKEATRTWDKLKHKCVVITTQLTSCIDDSTKPGKEIEVTFKGFSREMPEEEADDVTKCVESSEAEKMLKEEFKKDAKIDCYKSPSRSTVSVRSEPRGSIPVIHFVLGSLGLLILGSIPILAILGLLSVTVHAISTAIIRTGHAIFRCLLPKQGRRDQGGSINRFNMAGGYGSSSSSSVTEDEYQSSAFHDIGEPQRARQVFGSTGRTGSINETLTLVAQCPATLPEGTEDEDACAICMEDLSSAEEAKGAHKILPQVVRLPCSHWYHGAGCLERWIRRGSTLCPVCKFDLTAYNQNKSVT